MSDKKDTTYIRIKDDIINRIKYVYPISDAHMHIQGNDIAPIPIMQGVIYKNLPGLPKKKNINYEQLSYLKETPLNTTEEGISFLENRRNSHIVKDISEGVDNRKITTEIMAGSPVKLIVKDYGFITRFSSYDIAKQYFMFNDDISLGYIYKENSYAQATKNLKKSIGDISKSNLEFDKASAHYYSKTVYAKNRNLQAYLFSIAHGMELLYAHYWGAYGIPIYIGLEGKLYYIKNNLSIKIQIAGQITDSKLYNIYDTSEKLLDDYIARKSIYDFKKSEDSTKCTELADSSYIMASSIKSKKEKYVHFLVRAKDVEVSQFEDHLKHIFYQKLSALKFPFKLLPFYHFDARRFFAPVNTISQYHSFYIDDFLLKKSDASLLQKQFMDKGVFQNHMNIDELKKELIVNKGLFWGLKMYVALGYPPYLGLEDKNPYNPFPALDMASYKDLFAFYKWCAENMIPITCHASPQGMTIADPEIYLKEYLKQRPESKIQKEKKAFFQSCRRSDLIGLGLIDDFSSPASWTKVLNEVPKLKICFAHFGGSKFFDGTYKPDSMFAWQEEVALLIEKYPNVFTDISCYTTKKETPVLSSIIEKTSINSSDTQETIGRKIKNRIDSICEAGKNEKKKENELYQVYSMSKILAAYLESNKLLKERVLYGTDWPMLEMDEKLGTYNCALFTILQLVTHLLGNKWDVWHQFAVINPLLFLGLIEEEADRYVFSEKGKEKLKTYRDNMLEYLENSDIMPEKTRLEVMLFEYKKTLSDVSLKIDVLQREITNAHKELEQWFMDCCIPKAEDITILNESGELRMMLTQEEATS